MVNHCGYCQHYHKMGAKGAGVTPAQIAALESYETSSEFTPLEKAAIRFADQWTAKGKAEPAVVAELGKSLSPSQIIVLAAAVGLANWTNRFNETFAIELP